MYFQFPFNEILLSELFERVMLPKIPPGPLRSIASIAIVFVPFFKIDLGTENSFFVRFQIEIPIGFPFTKILAESSIEPFIFKV